MFLRYPITYSKLLRIYRKTEAISDFVVKRNPKVREIIGSPIIYNHYFHIKIFIGRHFTL